MRSHRWWKRRLSERFSFSDGYPGRFLRPGAGSPELNRVQKRVGGKVPGLTLQAQIVGVMAGDGKRPGTDFRLLRMGQATDVVCQTMRQHGIRRVQGNIKTPGGASET
jgi:hypothetical protein